jgi:hypothetical protein
MLISVINHTTIQDPEVQETLRAVNRQLAEDFEPYWSFGANLRLEGIVGPKPNPKKPEELRGDAIIYLWDGADVDDAIGYHEKNNRGIPYGFVFTEIAREIGEPWSVTLSHEALELVGDPEVNLLVKGPHPNPNERREVFHWFEMCDAVQAESYEIDGVAVSNFVLPLYFTSEAELGGRNDFLGTRVAGATLQSFGVNPGGYIGFYDPELDDYDTYAMDGDAIAKDRMRIKLALKGARRANRYRTPTLATKAARPPRNGTPRTPARKGRRK